MFLLRQVPSKAYFHAHDGSITYVECLNFERFIERSLSFVSCQPLEALINLVRLLTGAICLLLEHAARVLRSFLNGEREKKWYWISRDIGPRFSSTG